MQELVRARQEQARILKSLLGQVSVHSEECYKQQGRLNTMDIASYNQARRHTNPPTQGWEEEQYVEVRQVQSTLAGKKYQNKPVIAAPLPAGFVLPTSPPYDHLEDDMYDDLAGMGMEQQRTTQRIRSIPSRGDEDDDIIMVGASIPPTILENDNTRVEDFEVEEIYDNTVGLMDDDPNEEYVEEIYDDSLSLRMVPPLTTGALPLPQQNRRYSPLPPPPGLSEDEEIEEIYDDSYSLMMNISPPKNTTHNRKNAPLPPPPPPATVGEEEDEGIYDESSSLMIEPPPPLRKGHQNFNQVPQPAPIEEDIYDDSSSLMNEPPPPRHNQQNIVPAASPPDTFNDGVYDDSASLLTQPPGLPKMTNQPLPPAKWENANTSKVGKSLPPVPPAVQDDIYEDTYSMKQSQDGGNEQYTLLSSVRVTDRATAVGSNLQPSSQAQRAISPSPPPLPRRSPDTRLMKQQPSLLVPPSGNKMRSLSEPPPPLPDRSPNTHLSADYETPHRKMSSEDQQQIPRRVSSSEDVFVSNSNTPPLPPRRESLTKNWNATNSRKISSTRRKDSRTRSESSTQSSAINQPRFGRVSASDPPSVSTFQQRRYIIGGNNTPSTLNVPSKPRLVKKLSDPTAIRRMPLPPLPSQPEEEQKDYEYIDDNKMIEFCAELDREQSPQSYMPPIRRSSEDIQPMPQGYTPPIRRSSKELQQPIPQGYSPPIRRSSKELQQPIPQGYSPPIRRSSKELQQQLPQGYTPPIRRSSKELQQQPILQGYSPQIRRSSKELQPTNLITSHVQLLANKMPKQLRPVPTPASEERSHPDVALPLPPVVRVGDRAPMPLPPSTVSKPSTKISPPNAPGTVPTPPPPPPPPPVISLPNQTSRVPPPTAKMNTFSSPVGASHGTPAAPPPPSSAGNVPPPPPIFAGSAPPPPPPPPPIGGTKFGGPPAPPSVPTQSSNQQSDNPSPAAAQGMSDLLAGLSSVQLKKASDRELQSAPAQPSKSGGVGLQSNLMAEMQSFQLRKIKKTENNAPDPSSHANKAESDTKEVHSFQLRKTKRPNVDTPSSNTDGGTDSTGPSLQFQLRPTPGPNKQLNPATPPLKAKPIKPQPPPPKPKQPSSVSPPPYASSVGNGNVTSHDLQTNGSNMPEWKRAIMMKKQREQEVSILNIEFRNMHTKYIVIRHSVLARFKFAAETYA